MNPFSFQPWLRLALAAFLLIGSGSGAARGAVAPDFAAGNGRYAAGDYAGAAQAYEARVKQGRYSANLFANLGDAYYRLGDKGRAVLNYRRALLLEPAQAEASANLSFISGGRPGGTRNAAARAWDAAPWVAAVFGWLGAAGLLVAVANRRRRAAGIGWALGGFALCAGVAGLIWTFDGNAGNTAVAVVVAEGTPALYSPADNSKVVTTLPAGGEVRVLSEQGAWIYALLGDGTIRAWLSASKVEPLVPR